MQLVLNKMSSRPETILTYQNGTINTNSVLAGLTHVVSDGVTTSNMYAVQVTANNLSGVADVQFSNAFSSDGNFTNNQGVELKLHTSPTYWIGVQICTTTCNTDLRYRWCCRLQTNMEFNESGHLTIHGSLTQSIDARLKEEVQDVDRDNCAEFISLLRPVT